MYDIAGTYKVLADGISRWRRSDILSKLLVVAPFTSWQEESLGRLGARKCSAILQRLYRESEVHHGLWSPIAELLDYGNNGGT